MLVSLDPIDPLSSYCENEALYDPPRTERALVMFSIEFNSFSLIFTLNKVCCAGA